jgi:hypothetical protein
LKGFVYGEYGFRFCPHRDTYVGKEDFRGGKAIVLRAQDFKTIFGRVSATPYFMYGNSKHSVATMRQW